VRYSDPARSLITVPAEFKGVLAVEPVAAGYHRPVRLCDRPLRVRPGRRRRSCRDRAGAGTEHVGYGACVYHGGEEPRVKEAWRMAIGIAQELNVSPWDALLLEVRRSAGRCRWLDERLHVTNVREDERATLARALEADDDPEAPPDPGLSPALRRLLGESRAERRHLAVVSKAAIDAGVAERVVRQLELEGGLVAAAIVAGLDLLDLTPEQRGDALAAAHAHLTAIGSNPFGPSALGPGVT
jgi:hypothetical protein